MMQTHRVREACGMDGTDRHAPSRVAPNPQFIKIKVSPGHSKRTSACSDRSRGKGMGESRQAGRAGLKVSGSFQRLRGPPEEAGARGQVDRRRAGWGQGGLGVSRDVRTGVC